MRKNKGFTLIELLIVVAIIGIIAAIAIPNMLDALQRSRQKRTTGEIKTISTALQSFGTDYQGFPNNTHNGDIDPVNGVGLPAFMDADRTNILVPDQLQAYPVGDGWKSFYQYQGTAPAADARAWNTLNGEQIGAHFICASFGMDMAESVGITNGDQGGNTSTITAMAATWCVAPDAGVATTNNLSGNVDLHCYETDIMWGDSSFLQAPEGKQKSCGT